MSLRPRAPTLERDSGQAREAALDWLKTKRERCMSVIVGEEARKRFAVRVMRGDRSEMAMRVAQRLVDEEDLAQEGGMRRSSPVISMPRFAIMPGGTSTTSCFTQLSSIDRKRVRYARQWNVQLLGVGSGLRDGSVDKSHSDLLKLVGHCKDEASKMARLGDTHHLLVSAQWLYVTDVHRKILYVRHELQDITSIASTMDNNRHLLVLKTWQPPGLRFTCLVFACSSEDIIQDICKLLQGKFAKFSHIVAMSKHRRLCRSTPNLADVDDALEECAEEHPVIPSNKNLAVCDQEEDGAVQDGSQAFPFDEGYESHQSSNSPSCPEARSVSNLSPLHPARQLSAPDRSTDVHVGQKTDAVQGGSRAPGRLKWKGLRDKMRNAIFSKADKTSSSSACSTSPQKGKRCLDISGPTLVDPPAVMTGHTMKLPWQQDSGRSLPELSSAFQGSSDQLSSPVHLYDCVSEGPEVALTPPVLAMSNPLASLSRSQDSALPSPPPKPPRAHVLAASATPAEDVHGPARPSHLNGPRRNTPPQPLFSPPRTPPPPPEEANCPLYAAVGQSSPCPDKVEPSVTPPPPLPARPGSSSPPAVPQRTCSSSSSGDNPLLCTPQLITEDFEVGQETGEEAPPVPPLPAEHLLSSVQSSPRHDNMNSVSTTLLSASAKETLVDRDQETPYAEREFPPVTDEAVHGRDDASGEEVASVGVTTGARDEAVCDTPCGSCLPANLSAHKTQRVEAPSSLSLVEDGSNDSVESSQSNMPTRYNKVPQTQDSDLYTPKEKDNIHPQTDTSHVRQTRPGEMLQQLLSTTSGREELLAFAKELLPVLTTLHSSSTSAMNMKLQNSKQPPVVHTAKTARINQQQERPSAAAVLSSMPLRTARRQSLKRQAALQSNKQSTDRKRYGPHNNRQGCCYWNAAPTQKTISVYKVKRMLSSRKGRHLLQGKLQANRTRRKSSSLLALEEQAQKLLSRRTGRASSMPLLNLLVAAKHFQRSSSCVSKPQMLLI